MKSQKAKARKSLKARKRRAAYVKDRNLESNFGIIRGTIRAKRRQLKLNQIALNGMSQHTAQATR